ncbi:hypothetical protein E4U41_006804 [Claviceps citrina]|nr:hypothetical protein E4U41_006804 [Claviceps citrina]
MARPDRQASSSITSSSPASDLPPPPPTRSSSTAVIANTPSSSSSRRALPTEQPPIGLPLKRSHSHHQHHHQHQQHLLHQRHHDDDVDDSPSPSPSPSGSRSPPPVHPSILQPRVAVVLNVNPQWHPYLFAFRLLSIAPALWWGLPCALRLVLSILPGPDRVLVVRGGSWDGRRLPSSDDAVPFALTEGALATTWSFACGYLAFFFTDCLMSRWLIHYTPQATIVRLLTINAVNAYLTMTVLSLAGGFEDPRLMLPGWIGMATINIRKETSTSINVFSIASYISMVTLLAHMYSFQQDYPAMPLVRRVRRVCSDAYAMLAQVKGSIERAEL